MADEKSAADRVRDFKGGVRRLDPASIASSQAVAAEVLSDKPADEAVFHGAGSPPAEGAGPALTAAGMPATTNQSRNIRVERAKKPTTRPAHAPSTVRRLETPFRLTVDIETALHRKVKSTAALSGRKVADVVSEALTAWLARQKVDG